MNIQNLELTEEEVRIGWHWCPEWDGLLVGPGSGEWGDCISGSCLCGYSVPQPG